MNRAKGMNRLYLGMILTALAAPYLLGIFFTELTLYQSLALSEFIYLVPVLIYILSTRGQILNQLQVRLLPVSAVLMLILFGILLLPVVTWLNLFSMLFSANHVAGNLSGVGDNSFWQNLFYIAILPAAAEEFMFRGIYFHGIRPAGILKGALVSGLCFGLLHMNINQFIYAFVLGVVFALLVEAAGSVTASMIPHFIVNCSTVLALAVSGQMADEEELSQAAEIISRQDILRSLTAYTVIAVVCGALAVCVFVWLVRHCGRTEHMKQVLLREDRKAGRGGRVWTPALVLAVVLAAAYMVAVEYFL
ncbi:MAG: type II CAAX endopeptidase family protein [Lachnospiraceae bacterium]|nr:type II CAAX endopeptidase family protein [Lachnospiraceae bacterium]